MSLTKVDSAVLGTLNPPLTIGSGGTGLATITANSLLLGNGTGALQTVSPGTSGNVLTSNGTTWTSSPLGVIGVGQTWQNVTANRALGTNYTNTTGKPIFVNVVQYNGGANGVFITLTIDGVLVDRDGGWPGGGNPMYANVSGIVPNGSTYSAAATGGNASGGLNNWSELR